MDQDKIAKFIKMLREESGVKQEELADKLSISRQTVSKWETGKSVPDILMIKSLSRIFKVPVNDILNGQKNSNDDDLTLKMFESRNKMKRLVKRLLISIILLLIFFLVYYFISSYNSIKVYTINAESDDVSISNGLLLDTDEKIYFQLGEMINKTNDSIKDLTLYYIDGEDRVTVYACTSCSTTKINFIDFKVNNEYLDTTKIKDILNRFYLEITFTNDYKKNLKLKFKRDYSNNKIFSKFSSKKIEEDFDNSYKYNLPIENNVVDKIKKSFQKNDDGYSYNFEDKNQKVSASYLNNELFIDIETNKEIEYWSFNFETKNLRYELYKGDKLDRQESFNIENNKNINIYEKFIDILEFIFNNSK